VRGVELGRGRLFVRTDALALEGAGLILLRRRGSAGRPRENHLQGPSVRLDEVEHLQRSTLSGTPSVHQKRATSAANETHTGSRYHNGILAQGIEGVFQRGAASPTAMEPSMPMRSLRS